MTKDVLKCLQERKMLEMVSDPQAIEAELAKGPLSVYVGFDPSASSLHVGHLLPIMALAHFQRAGHRPIPVVGGATGMIGDPSGRSSERQLLTADVVAYNASCIKKQLQNFLKFDGENAAEMVDNYDWIGSMSYVDWLRDVGKYFTVNYMIAKESVRRRLEDREHGISYTEFSYMLLQAYDFLHLFRTKNCLIQCGGSDQWGNITAGIDLIRKVTGKSAYGITLPLVCSSSGEKFGKSAGNAVWLDPKKTSPFKFYQYWIQTNDLDVKKFLGYFTFLEIEEIDQIVTDHQKNPERRTAQKKLAEEITRLVHGSENLKKAVQATEVLFGGEITELSDSDLREIFADVPSSKMPRLKLEAGIKLVEMLTETKMTQSKGEAKRLVESGGVYLNNKQCRDSGRLLDLKDLASERVMVLRSGKKNYHLVEFFE